MSEQQPERLPSGTRTTGTVQLTLTVEFLLRNHRNKAAARRYFEKSIVQNGVPETVTVDKSRANLETINNDRETPIKIRQSKYLKNLVEQDHRAIKRRTRPILELKTFRCAPIWSSQDFVESL